MRMNLADALAHQARVARGKSARIGALGVEGAAAVEKEHDLHDDIIAFCKASGFYYVHSRMDRRTTQAKGVPDFIIAAGEKRTLWIEAKANGKKATAEQLGAIVWLRKLGHEAHLVYSIEEFREIVRTK